MRLVWDAVSTFINSVALSLKSGTIVKNKLEMEFEFKFIFKHKPAKVGESISLERDDFNSIYFKGNWMTVYDRNGDGCTVRFPMTAKLRLKWSSPCYDRQEDGTVVQKKKNLYRTITVVSCKSTSIADTTALDLC